MFELSAKRRDAAVADQALQLASTFFHQRAGNRVYLWEEATFAPRIGDYAEFWDDALLCALKRDLDIRHSQNQPPWDLALSDAQLRDAVVHVHHVLFACVSAVVLNMHHFDVDQADIDHFAQRSIDRAELTRDQRNQLHQAFATLGADRRQTLDPRPEPADHAPEDPLPQNPPAPPP